MKRMLMTQYLATLFLLCAGLFFKLEAGDCFPFFNCNVCSTDGYSSVYLGPQWYYSTIKTWNGTSQLATPVGQASISKIQGNMRGFSGGYRYLKPCGIYAHLDFSMGLSQIGGENAPDRYVHDYLVEGRFGYELFSWNTRCADIDFIPYLALGYYYSAQDLQANSPTQLTKGGNRYRLTYLPIGVCVKTTWFDCWQVGCRMAWFRMLDTMVKLTALKGAYWDMQNHTGFYFEFPIAYQNPSSCWFVKIEPFYRRFFLGRSTAVSPTGVPLGLPASVFTQRGVKLVAGFDF